jgi:hypothetical protein
MAGVRARDSVVDAAVEPQARARVKGRDSVGDAAVKAELADWVCATEPGRGRKGEALADQTALVEVSKP